MNLKKVFKNSLSENIDIHQKLIDLLPEVNLAIKIIFKKLKLGGKLLLCGNGGSASDAQHLVAEYLVRLRPKVDRKPLPAITLAQDTSTLTACGNYYLFDDIFLRPFQAIDFHRKRAVSKKYESSSYVFFENKRGFNFCTIEYLLDSGSSQEKINDKRFVLDTPNNTNIRNLSYRNIIALNNISLADNTTKMTSGSLNMRVKRFDLLTGTVEVSSYVNKEQQSKFKFSSKTATPINTSFFEDRYGKTPAISLLVPYSSEFQENYIGGSLGAKHSYVNKLDQNLFYAHINGDTEITVGDVITIDVPSTDGGTAGGGKDRLLQGNYLISKLRHIVKSLSGLQRSHTMSIELIKGSYEDTI